MVQLYFKDLGDTRNYYSHYKLDANGVLEFNQMLDSIDVLKATIISILFSHMGVEKELIRKIMAFDNELKWQTMCLQNATDRPFKPPHEVMKIDQKSEEEEMKSKKKKRTVLGRLRDKISHLKKKD